MARLSKEKSGTRTVAKHWRKQIDHALQRLERKRVGDEEPMDMLVMEGEQSPVGVGEADRRVSEQRAGRMTVARDDELDAAVPAASAVKVELLVAETSAVTATIRFAS